MFALARQRCHWERVTVAADVAKEREVGVHIRPDAFGVKESDASVVSIANDFSALVAIFERQLALVSPTDAETLSHLRKAKQSEDVGLGDIVSRVQALALSQL